MYIYIYIYVEREICIYKHIYIYIYTHIIHVIYLSISSHFLEARARIISHNMISYYIIPYNIM